MSVVRFDLPQPALPPRKAGIRSLGRLGRDLLPAFRTILDVRIIGVRSRAEIPVRRLLRSHLNLRLSGLILFDVNRGGWLDYEWRGEIRVERRWIAVVKWRKKRCAYENPGAGPRNDGTTTRKVPAVCPQGGGIAPTTARMATRVPSPLSARTTAPTTSKRVGCDHRSKQYRCQQEYWTQHMHGCSLRSTSATNGPPI